MWRRVREEQGLGAKDTCGFSATVRWTVTQKKGKESEDNLWIWGPGSETPVSQLLYQEGPGGSGV